MAGKVILTKIRKVGKSKIRNWIGGTVSIKSKDLVKYAGKKVKITISLA